MMQLRSKRNSRRLRNAVHGRPTVELKPLRIEISDEDILADLLYPAPTSALGRRS
jgi:hypothetical protein